MTTYDDAHVIAEEMFRNYGANIMVALLNDGVFGKPMDTIGYLCSSLMDGLAEDTPRNRDRYLQNIVGTINTIRDRYDAFENIPPKDIIRVMCAHMCTKNLLYKEMTGYEYEFVRDLRGTLAGRVHTALEEGRKSLVLDGEEFSF